MNKGRIKLTPDAIPMGVDVHVYTAHLKSRSVTTAVITPKDKAVAQLYIGAAIKMPQDKYDADLAVRIAIGRALKDYYSRLNTEKSEKPHIHGHIHGSSELTKLLHQSELYPNSPQPTISLKSNT